MGLVRREWSHWSDVRRGKKRLFIQKLEELGRNSFSWTEICQTKDKRDAIELETEFIKNELLTNGALCLNINIGSSPNSMSREAQSKAIRGPKNGMYDHVNYNFAHDTHGRVCCTRNELKINYNLDPSRLAKVIKGKEASVKGWRLV